MVLQPERFSRAVWSPNTLVGSYPTFSPLPVPEGHRRSESLKHCLSPLRAPPLSESSVPYAVRTFLTDPRAGAVEHLELRRYSVPRDVEDEAVASPYNFNRSDLPFLKHG